MGNIFYGIGGQIIWNTEAKLLLIGKCTPPPPPKKQRCTDSFIGQRFVTYTVAPGTIVKKIANIKGLKEKKTTVLHSGPRVN